VDVGEVSSSIHGDFERELRLAVQPGDKVVVLGLERQDGSATVTSVVQSSATHTVAVATAHDVHEGGRLRTYLLIHSGLGRLEPGVVVGATLDTGATLGYAPSDAEHSASGRPPEIVLAARLMHEGLTPDFRGTKKLTDPTMSLAVDLRNALPLRVP
jgi:hypothetical protein